MNNDILCLRLPAVEFWFDFSSNYSYLSAMRIEHAAAQRGVAVHWRPFLLGPIFQSFGWPSSPFVLQKEKGAHVWKDMERQCAKYALPWQRPSVFPRAATMPMKVAAAHADAAWIGRYCRIFMTKNFALDEDINAEAQVTEVLTGLGLDAATMVTHAVSDAGKHRLREATAQAQAIGVFGAPTFFARDELFWGNDRLDDALDFALIGARGQRRMGPVSRLGLCRGPRRARSPMALPNCLRLAARMPRYSEWGVLRPRCS